MSGPKTSSFSDEQRAQFCCNLSHQFSEPLNVILNGTEYIRASLKEGTIEQQREAIRISAPAIQDSVRWLDRLAQNMVDVLALWSGGLRPNCQVLEVTGMLNNLLQLCLPYAHRQNIALHWNVQQMPAQMFVFADRSFFDRVLLNLLSNAILYAKPNGNVWVEMDATDLSCCIRIKDDGPGISSEDMKLLFDPFRSANAAQHSVGVGLYLANEFCKAMDWQLQLESGQEGTTALIYAPLTISPQNTPVIMKSGMMEWEICLQEQAKWIHREMAALFGELELNK